MNSVEGSVEAADCEISAAGVRIFSRFLECLELGLSFGVIPKKKMLKSKKDTCNYQIYDIYIIEFPFIERGRNENFLSQPRWRDRESN